MAERSFYDILEVSSSASQDTIEASYKRLAEKFDPTDPANANNAAARMQYDALRQAYMILGSADSRAGYDRKLAQRNAAPAPVRAAEVLEPFWTLPKLLVVGAVVLSLGGFYFKHQKDQARLEAEKVIAVAKAKEAEEKARAEAEAQRIAMQMERDRERAERNDAIRQRRERDADLRQAQRETRANEISGRVYGAMDRAQAQNEDYRRRAEEARIKREEMQAAAAANQALARDKAELCRIERERYGKAISC